MALVARWQFENNANDTVGTNHGSATDVTYQTSTYMEGGYSAYFTDTTPSAIAITFLDLHTITNYTFMSWLKPISGKYCRGICESGVASNTSQTWYAITDTGALTYIVRKQDATYLLNLTSTATVTYGRWSHIAIVDANGSAVGYINGVAVLSGSYTRADCGCDRTKIGAIQVGSGTYGGVGNVDDVRYYNEALSAGAIAKMYAQECQRYGEAHP